MNKIITKTLFLTILLLISFHSKATIKTASTGNWNAPGTWSPAGVPSCGDTIIIPVGVSVHIPANVNLDDASNPLCAKTVINVMGSITFANGRKLRLVFGGCVNISLGGTIVPSGVGGGSSELIEIDDVKWWKAADGTLTGDADGVQLGCGVLLPIVLSDFSLEYQTEQVNISFTTTSERDVDYFMVESSRDGSFWQTIEVIDAAGNTSSSHTYNTVDKDPFIGLSYYRLSHVTINGVTNVEQTLSSEFNSVKYLIYPIPVNKTMFLEGNDLESAIISVVNAMGELIEVEKTLVGDKFSFEFSEIKSGVYFIVIETGNTKKTERVVVVHK